MGILEVQELRKKRCQCIKQPQPQLKELPQQIIEDMVITEDGIILPEVTEVVTTMQQLVSESTVITTQAGTEVAVLGNTPYESKEEFVDVPSDVDMSQIQLV